MSEVASRLRRPLRRGEVEDFRGATIDEALDLSGADLPNLDFTGATFQAPLTLRGAHFQGLAWFAGATFNAPADFSSALFLSDGRFEGATFHRVATFSSAEFRGVACFDRAEFRDAAFLDRMTCYGNLSLDRTRFARRRIAAGQRVLRRPVGQPHGICGARRPARPRSAWPHLAGRCGAGGRRHTGRRRPVVGRDPQLWLSLGLTLETTMTMPRERFGYSSPFTRPALKLPGGARLIVWTVVNVEEWEITRPMARQLSIAPQGQSVIPDMPNWTWYEYGMRVGFWRLMRALDKAGVTPTMSLNAKICETYREVAAAARDAGWEFMAHSVVQMPIQQIEDQRAVMRQSIDIIKAFTGQTPQGWLGPGRGQTFDTLDYATECGFRWFGDWVLDDQPFWVKTRNGPILSVPYSAEINDITLMVSHHHESDVLLTRTIDAFDRLYEESRESARVLAIGVHPYVTGAAHRIRYFEELYKYINAREGVLHWTGQQIYDWYAGLVPPPR